MRTTRTWRHGSSPASATGRCCTKSRSPSRKCLHRRGATNRRLGPGAWDQGLGTRVNFMRLNLKIWRQAGPNVAGRLVKYVAEGVSPDMSFLEMLDVVNERLVRS